MVKEQNVIYYLEYSKGRDRMVYMLPLGRKGYSV